MRRKFWSAALVVGLGVTLAGCGGRQDAAGTDAGGDVTCEVAQRHPDRHRDRQRDRASTSRSATPTPSSSRPRPAARSRRPPRRPAPRCRTSSSWWRGTYQVAFSLADTAADAVQGKGSFTAPQPVQALARIYTNYTQVVVAQGRRHHHGRRHAGQAGLHRLAEVRHRGHRQPAAHGGRPRPGQGHQGAAARPDQDRRRHEGRLDRRDVLVRRPAHAGHHRPVHHAPGPGDVPRHHAAAAGDEEDQPGVRGRHDPGRHLQHCRPTPRPSSCRTCCW